MDLFGTSEALSNQTCLEILKGLKDPAKNFPPQDKDDVDTVGACVSSIQEGVDLSQSTVPNYLVILQRTGLAEVGWINQWTYYKRNEVNTHTLVELVGVELQFFLRHDISRIPDIPLYRNENMR